MADRHAERAAPTINDLADRFDAEHLSKRRPSTRRDYRSFLRLYIRPALGVMKVADVRHTDIERLHAGISKTAPYSANRTVAVLSKMMVLAVKYEIRTDNPVKGIERAPEEKRERYSLGESQMPPAQMQQRVNWQKQYAYGQATKTLIRVHGFRQADDTLWQINQIVSCTVARTKPSNLR